MHLDCFNAAAFAFFSVEHWVYTITTLKDRAATPQRHPYQLKLKLWHHAHRSINPWWWLSHWFVSCTSLWIPPPLESKVTRCCQHCLIKVTLLLICVLETTHKVLSRSRHLHFLPLSTQGQCSYFDVLNNHNWNHTEEDLSECFWTHQGLKSGQKLFLTISFHHRFPAVWHCTNLSCHLGTLVWCSLRKCVLDDLPLSDRSFKVSLIHSIANSIIYKTLFNWL